MTSCGLLDLLHHLGKKWFFIVFTHLGTQPQSYNDLCRISNHLINPTLLSTTLKQMVELGLIEQKGDKRKVYALTMRGKRVQEQLSQLKEALVEENMIPSACVGKPCACTRRFARNS